MDRPIPAHRLTNSLVVRSWRHNRVHTGADHWRCYVTTDATPPSTLRSGRVPSAQVVIGGVYALCVLVPLASLTLVVALDLDPEGPDTARREIIDIGLVGTTALMIGVLPGLYLARSDSASRIGAIVYGALSLLTIVFFWSGAPGILGAVATWLGGLTRGRTSLHGAPGLFAIIGLCIAILNCTVSVAWFVVGAFVGR